MNEITDSFSCNIDECFVDYRESYKVSDRPHRCVECGYAIPAGEPFIMCEGTYDEAEGGSAPEWEGMPQHLECYRFCRKLNHENEACPPFGGLDSCLDALWPDLKWPVLKWSSIKSKIRTRIAKGYGPWECWSVDGEWQPDLLYGNRFPGNETLGVPRKQSDNV